MDNPTKPIVNSTPQDMQEREEARLRALYRYDVLDTPPEESFDRITRLAKSALQAPIAMVSLVDRHRQWFKSRQGTETTETPRCQSFCTHTIAQPDALVVPDALEDARFCDSPLVTGEPHVRAYVGVPLRSPDGHNIGALCINDTKPRTVSPEQLNFLQDLARLVVDELELRLLASTDSLTGALTARAFLTEANKEIARARRHERSLGCIMFDIDHFKKINDTHGHAIGDRVLARVGAACREVLRQEDVLGRLGGEEFAVVLPESGAGVRETAERLRRKLSELQVTTAEYSIGVTASFGATALRASDTDVKDMIARADGALYEAKRAGRNCVHITGPNPPSASSAA